MKSKKFKYSITLLNVFVFISELFFLIYSLVKWQELTKGDGYGLVALIIIAIIFLTGLFVDIILQLIIKNKIIMNAIGTIFIGIYLYICIINS